MGKIMHFSRKQDNFMRRLGKDVNEMDHMMHFIASCNIKDFIQFVHITRVSNDLRKIEYEIRIPKGGQANEQSTARKLSAINFKESD